jgi:hypothetical protein
MTRWLIIMLCALIALSAGRVGAAEPAPYDLKLSAAMVGVVETALARYSMPWEQSNPVLQEIARQIRDQDIIRQAGPKSEPEAPKPPGG